MSHFAQIDGNNIVTQVIVIEQDVVDTGLFGDPASWIQTSYNTSGGVHTLGGTPLRKNYAGGGGGGVYTTGTLGSGGLGGGGNGGSGGSAGAGSPGTANTGGGGGGGAAGDGPGANGGSGIVIIRYADSYAAATSTTGSPTITTGGGYRVYKYTSSGSITF